jgi:hypothetical protein
LLKDGAVANVFLENLTALLNSKIHMKTGNLYNFKNKYNFRRKHQLLVVKNYFIRQLIVHIQHHRMRAD